MSRIQNMDRNIIFELELINNSWFDYIENRSDYENWIPFNLKLSAENEKFTYLDEDGATFSLYEIQRLITEFERIIKQKANNIKVETYDFYSSEAYFEWIISDPLEEKQLTFELWINIGTYTKGRSYGYDKGYRFEVSIEEFENFTKDLKKELHSLLSKSN